MVRRIYIVQRVCKHYMFKFAAAKESWQIELGGEVRWCD